MKNSTSIKSEITLVPTENLIPYARNARTHSDAQVAQIAASIQEFGWTNPVLIDGENGIIAGHGRVLAARKLGIEKIPCIELSHLTKAQKQAYILADNKLAMNAGWDMALLATELLELDSLNFNLDLTGFGKDEIEQIMIWSPDGLKVGLTDPDETPELEEEPVSKQGDVWILGKHRLVCGDSTVATDVEKALNGVVPHLMVTDPPYGVNYDPEWRLRSGVNKPNQKQALGKVKNDNTFDWTAAWTLFSGDVTYVWHGGLYTGAVQSSLEVSGFKIRSQIIWAKKSLVIGRGDYHWQHEPCWYAVREGKTGHWNGDRKQTTVWNIPNMHRTQGNVDDGKTEHSTQKPVECMRRPIENNSSPGQAVYEPFSGSGTTIIACEQTGRICHAIELNPAYVDMAVRRWQNFTGKEAILESNHETFNQIEERAKTTRSG